MTAPLPPQPLPKSNASINFLAVLLVAKFLDGLPPARFEHVLARHGALVPRQTRWVISAAAVLQPLHNLLRDLLLDGALIHMDETVQVLKEAGKTPDSNSYMWVQTGGPPERPVVLYDYESLADELFRVQPNMFSSILVLQRMGVSLEKMDFALNLLFICFQSMN